MHKFTTEVELIVTGTHKVMGFSGDVSLLWTLEVESTGEDVEFVVKVPDQTVTCNAWFYDEETDEEFQQEVNVELKNVIADVGSSSIKQGLRPFRLDIFQKEMRVVFV